ncbi:MAG: glycosyltransferase family 4 protein [Deltaproteobacteria bacterium]|nr:glycosyltransferase family 4 protein [Deltaproteobacteria bacterium]
MKTIALALEHFNRFAGGAESYAVSLARSLVKAGWEVHLFGESWDGEPEGAVFHRMNIPRWWPGWARILRFALEHRRRTGSGAFQIVLGFGNTIYMNVYQSHGGVHWCSSRRLVYAESNVVFRWVKRLVIGLSPKQWMRHWIESAPFRMSSSPRIIAISQMVKDDMVRSFGIDGQRIELVYNGVDTARFYPGLRDRFRGPWRRTLGLGPEEVVFLLVAYALKKKGIIPLIEAAKILKDRLGEGFRVVVAGGQPSLRLSSRLARLNLSRTVIFAGRIRNMEECYANSDVLVLPTFYDAGSLVVFEAMASQLPCITTRANGSAGIITEGVDGFILDHPPQAEDLAKKMALLLDPTRRESMGRAAANKVLGYTIERNHQAVLQILDEVAGR